MSDIQTQCRLLDDFKLKELFIDPLGWDHHNATLSVDVDGETFTLAAVAEKRGFAAFVCEAAANGRIPPFAARDRIDRHVTKSVREHIIIYTDRERSEQLWQWVRRAPGRPIARREYPYRCGQRSGMLIERVLPNISFELAEEDGLSLVDVTTRARAGFDVERVTKRFYDRFKTEHEAFTKFLRGIPDESLQAWYVSVMLNRLMFIYFIQKKRFLNDDADYLGTKLAESRRKGRNGYYRKFLCPLFFEGFARQPQDRSTAVNKLLGTVPYLNGGLFLRHQIEEAHGEKIQIADAAFERLFKFFDAYRWHLDERLLRDNNEINPDVLGYIFEKYINQKQMGAYYTKEDITDYIGKNTIIPFLFDAARKECKIAFKPDGAVWRLLRDDPDRYIYEAVRRGVVAQASSLQESPAGRMPAPQDNILPESALPDFVQKGMHDPKARMFNKRYNLGKAEITWPPCGAGFQPAAEEPAAGK
ncbi:MAG: SAM-dependent methyltransferase, partial [Dehalococcoidia bacterium]